MFSLYFTLQIKEDIKHKQKTTRETRGNLEQSFARELLGNGRAESRNCLLGFLNNDKPSCRREFGNYLLDRLN